MFAKVIVDVPSKQVNRPFEYHIPSELEGTLEVGMRVAVPFGQRSVQGFVVNIVEQKSFTGDVKPIDRVLDTEPVLSKELLLLGEYMAQQVFAFLISCYQTMLPQMLKSTYQKRFYIIDHMWADDAQDVTSERALGDGYDQVMDSFEREELLFTLFKGKRYIDVTNDTPAETLHTLLRLKKAGYVTVETIVKSRISIKTEDWVYRNVLTEQVAVERSKLKANAVKQIALLEAIKTIPAVTGMRKKELMEKTQTNSAHIRSAIDKGWLKLEQREVDRDPYKSRQFEKTAPLSLTEEQQAVFEKVKEDMNDGIHKTYLLEGVTGSGKTELYLQWIAFVLQADKTALVLVPEIALTPQMVTRFKSRFGTQVAVLHSGLSEGERYDEWRKIKSSEAKIVVGARSSIFAPLDRIGMIILDEEHEATYKQDESPRYHARDIAIWRGNYHRCPVILGSATPSLDSRARAQKNVYQLLQLTKRAQQQALPSVNIVDMRAEFSAMNRSSFSRSLQEAISARLERKEQVVLLLNRRGYSSFIMCRDCGHVVQCPNCDISLTLHMDTKVMKCHYCDHQDAIPHRCPKCYGDKIRYYGTGTQKIQDELEDLFPTARVIRMDVDTTRKKGEHERLLKVFENQEADILLGTQMIAKGLDYPRVTLVGVLNADTALNLPDFRSFERTFQLLTQVAGRAGRSHLPGEVIIQSFNPTHYAIEFAKQHDYEGFYRKEMSVRRIGQYPPYFFVTMLTVSSEKEGLAFKHAATLRRFLAERLSQQTIILGPTAKSIARMNNRYYFQILIKYKQEPGLSILLNEILNASQGEIAKQVNVSIDVEPIQFL